MKTQLSGRVAAALAPATIASFGALGVAAPAAAQTPTAFAPPPGFVQLGHGSTQSQQVSTRECMAAAGFEYVPHVVEYDVYQRVGPDGQAGTPSVVTPQLVHTDAPGTDPNDDIIADLTVPRRVAYYHALYGPSVQLDEEGDPAGPSLTSDDQACALSSMPGD
jgi:hypothetical protein